MVKNWWKAGALALAVASTLTPAWAQADDFDALRLRWQTRLAGPAWLDRQSSEVAAQLGKQADAARQALDSMHREPGAKVLWDDIGDFNDPDALKASTMVTANMRRVGTMAQAYATPGSPAYHDARLAQGVVAGLEWLVREHYRAGRPQTGNWWHWQIGAPLSLLDTLTLAHDVVPAELRERCLAAVDWYVPTPFVRTRADGSLSATRETGANLLDKALLAILSGTLAKDGARVAAGRDGIAPTLDYVAQGDGFYRDGSFIQHTHFAYAGSYGVVALADYAQLLYLLNGSAWPYAGPDADRVFAFALDSFVPLMIDGAMPDAYRGRKIAERVTTEGRAGRSVAASLALLAELAPPSEAGALRSAIKGWSVRSGGFSPEGYAGLPLYEQALLKRVAADKATEPAQAAPGARVYAAMDRAVLRGKDFTAVISMTSPRTGSYENGNGENLKAWWTGMGMLALYDGDRLQFSNDYWPTVDSMRLPGTTTDRSGIAKPEQWKQYPNTEHWVGGASLGRYAALGMAFSMREVTGSPLQGRKAWFLLEDRILALGSGIGGGQGATETVVENRRLSDPAGARLLVDGAPLPNGVKTAARWAHLRDDKAGSRIGYVFPLGSQLKAERAERRGAWRDISAYASKDEVRNSYQVLAVPHGQPDYAYLLLPNASEAETRAAAAEPGLRIEANNSQAAAVYLPHQGVYAANLWRAGDAPRDGKRYVSSSAPAALVVQRSAGRLRLAVAEPTQKEAMLELVLREAVVSAGELSPGVTVLEMRPQLRLRIDTAKAAGAGFTAEFVLVDTSEKRRTRAGGNP